MKSYREIADSVFARREQYVTAQRKKKKLLASAGATLCAVSLLGGSVWYLNRPTHNIPVTPATDDDAVTTTVTTAPTEQDVTTTTTTVDTPTTDGGIVTPSATVTTVAPTQTTTKPTTGKTEQTQTTTTTGTKGSVTGYIPPIPTTTKPTTSAGSDRLLITGDGSDVFDQTSSISAGVWRNMQLYKDMDVTFAVVVAIRAKQQDSVDFWESTEELSQLNREINDTIQAFDEEAKRFNPDYKSDERDIKVWTDSMLKNREQIKILVAERDNAMEQYYGPYVENLLNQRYETLKALCDMEPVDISCEINGIINVCYHKYYAELTADAITALAEQGGFFFCLTTSDVMNQ